MNPSCVLFLLLTLLATSFERVLRVRKGDRVGRPWVHDGGFALLRGPLIRHILGQHEYMLSDLEGGEQIFGRNSFDNFGGISSGEYNDVRSQHGRFNADMMSCSGIESQRCSEPSDCAGCLGLYSCNVSIQKCQLKGLSRSPSRFQKSLEQI